MAQETGRIQVDAAALDAGVEHILQTRNIPGATIAVYDEQGLIWAHAYGFADLRRRVRTTVDTRFQIGSLTKTFTATLAMVLRDEGIIGLDDPIARWLEPDVALPVSPEGGAPRILIQHLLTHTSGLPTHPVNRIDAYGVMQPYSVRDLYAGLREADLQSPVGSTALYSNLGFGLLGRVLERAAGVPYEQVLHQRVLAPLGMNSTTITLTSREEATLAEHYWPTDQSRRAQRRWVFGEVAAFGGLTSTAPDLANYLSFQMRAGRSGRVGPLSGSSLLEMQQAHAHWGPLYDFGLGWQIWRSRAFGKIITHGGEVDGHGSHAAFSPAVGVGVVVLANLGGSAAGDIGNWLLGEVLEAARSQVTPSRVQALAFSVGEDWANAAWAWEALASARPDDPEPRYRSAIAYFYLDRFDRAVQAAGQALRLGGDPASVHFVAGRAHAAAGHAEDALREVGAAVSAGYGFAEDLRSFPEFESVRNDPRWAPLIEAALAN